MTTLAMLRRSGPTTLLVHVVRIALGAVAAAPLATALQTTLLAHVYHRELDAGDAALLLQITIGRIPSLIQVSGVVAALHLLLTPWLAMLWLHSMLPRVDLDTPARRAFGNYAISLRLGAAALVTFLALCALLLSTAIFLWPGQLAASSSTYLRVAVAFVGMLAFVGVSVLHDRARAAVCQNAASARAALVIALRAARGSDFAYRGLLAVGFGLFAFGADLAARATSGYLAPWAIAGLQQLCLFPATVLQALWLTRTLKDAARSRTVRLRP